MNKTETPLVLTRQQVEEIAQALQEGCATVDRHIAAHRLPDARRTLAKMRNAQAIVMTGALRLIRAIDVAGVREQVQRAVSVVKE